MEIQILTKEEISRFNKAPIFNIEEQKYFFTINRELLKQLTSNFKIENIGYFILLYGYFKATSKFFTFLKSDKNLKFIQERYNITSISEDYSDRTTSLYKQKIRDYFINESTDEIKETLQKSADQLANNFINRKAIFYSLVELSKKLNIEIPSYTELSRIITLALNSQKKDILDKLLPYVEDKRLEILDEFLQKDIRLLA